jgi:hypothetical protein
LIGLWYVRRFLGRRNLGDAPPLAIDIEGHHETFEQYVARHQREFGARAHARNLEERRVCHQLAPIVGGVAAIYGFINESSLISRAEMAAIYFAVGYLAIWATWLFDWLLRPTMLSTAAQFDSLGRQYFKVAQLQSKDGPQAQLGKDRSNTDEKAAGLEQKSL